MPLLVLSLITTAVILNGCKKSDTTEPTNPETETALDPKFFSLPANAPKALTAVAKRIQKDDNKHHFLESFISRVGYPKWDFAKLVPANTLTPNGRLSNEMDSVLLVPFVKDSANSVNALLMVKMSSADTSFQVVQSNRYHTYGFDSTDHSKWNAWDVFHMFTRFDNIVFGHKSFLVKDPLLFSMPNDSSQTIVTIKSTINTSGRNSTNRISTYTQVAECTVYEVCPYSCYCIARLAGTQSSCISWAECTYYWVPSGGSSGGGGGGGGTTGGNYYWTDPCASTPPPTPNPERISTNEPAAGGGCTSTGWAPIKTEIFPDLNELGNFNDDDANYTEGNNDNTPYSQHSEIDPWPTIASVIPISLFVEYDRSNCLDLAKRQIGKMGYTISAYHSPGQTFQIYSEHTGINLNVAKDGVSYLLSALKRGIPVIVGIDYKPSTVRNGNPDGSTDHFVVIVGAGSDANGKYFTFYDNATNYSSKGASPLNKLYYNETTGKIEGQTRVTYSDGTALPKYMVTQIRKSKVK